MLTLETIKEYSEEKKLNLETINEQIFLIKVCQDELNNVFKMLKSKNANLKLVLASTKNLIRYFFYLKEPKGFLCIEVKSENKNLESLRDYYPILKSYENEMVRDFGLKLDLIESDEYIAVDNPASSVIPVGPVHAGVIEPGHFHFSILGEHIINLEIRLGYKHKGIEKDFEGKSIEEGLNIAEHICGDNSYSYGLSFIQAAESYLQVKPDQKTLYLRTLILELERLYNHIGDLAGLINDTGFSVANAHLAVLKEKMLRINHKYFGHRFLRNILSLGTLNKIPSNEELKSLKAELDQIKNKFESIIKLTINHNTVTERFANTGTLSYDTAKDLSISGLIGRASGINFDSRRDLPFAAYEELDFKVHMRHDGDVLSRFYLRHDEALEAFSLIKYLIKEISELITINKELKSDLQELPFNIGVAESPRGEVITYLELDKNKKITRCKIRDISLHNWKGLEKAVLGNIVPDFPLCNKSFSLAYAGSDM